MSPQICLLEESLTSTHLISTPSSFGDCLSSPPASRGSSAPPWPGPPHLWPPCLLILHGGFTQPWESLEPRMFLCRVLALSPPGEADGQSRRVRPGLQSRPPSGPAPPDSPAKAALHVLSTDTGPGTFKHSCRFLPVVSLSMPSVTCGQLGSVNIK
jgi:hypothetical protein